MKKLSNALFGIKCVAVFCFFTLFVIGAQAQDNRPNIILFMSDDVSAGDFGSYGHPTIQTPNIDNLAANGLRFENAYLTTSSCSPSRTSLITGRYPHNTGAPELHMVNSPYLENLPQFPHLLRKAGYYSAQAGKEHFNGDASKSFEVMGGGGNSGSENWVSRLQERPKDKPFFMWFSSYDAHRNWDQPLSDGPHGVEDVRVPPYMVDGPMTRKDLAHYYNEIHRFDKNIGLVLDELKRQGVYENTLIIVVSDNGRPFPRSKWWLYDSGIKTPLVMYWPDKIVEPAVPKSLVSVIDLPPTILELAGVSVPSSFQGVSLTPFIEDPDSNVRDFVFAERNWHAQRHHERMVRYGNFVYIRNNLPELVGMNLVHYAFDRAGRYRDGQIAAYSELVDHWRAGKATDAQKDVVMKPRPEEMLFDVSKDPHQLNNLAENMKYADQLEFLRKALDMWTEQTGDTVPEFDDMTPDRANRQNWEEGIGSGRPEGGEVPGQSTEAWNINHSGPIHIRNKN
ncbi:MAG: sulfatase [Balneolaceae bacterium]|nr:sulfatase [Balneolaceae bacterium]